MLHSTSRNLTAFAFVATISLALAAPALLYAAPQSLSSGLGATTVNRDFPTCMNQTYGHHEKLTVEVLQGKLSSAKLTAQQRRETEEDIKWLNAIAGGAARNLPSPDPRNPQRYLLLLTDSEQVQINTANNRYMIEIRNKCEAQYGGMSQFADPAGRRRVSSNESMSAPAPAPVASPPSATSRLEEFNNCTAARSGLLYKSMADRLDVKFVAARNLSPAERKAWEEDIAVVRAAQSSPAKMPMSPDPKNPMRWMTRLSADDQMAINQAYASESQALLNKCSGASRAGSGASATAPPSTSAAPAPQNTPRSSSQQQSSGGGGSLSAALGATRADYLERGGVVACYDRMKGHMAKVTADKLEAKLKTVSGLTPQQRKEWNEDIASWRAAEAAKAEQPVPPDPNNPYRWQSRLTRTERQEIQMAHSAFVNKIRDECNSMDHMETKKKPG